MSTRKQQQSTWWPTAKAYASLMELPYPILMRDEVHDEQAVIKAEAANLIAAFENLQAIRTAHDKYFTKEST